MDMEVNQLPETTGDELMLSDDEESTWGIKAVRADQSAYTGKGATVAILDTGIDETHERFARDTPPRNYRGFAEVRSTSVCVASHVKHVSLRGIPRETRLLVASRSQHVCSWHPARNTSTRGIPRETRLSLWHPRRETRLFVASRAPVYGWPARWFTQQ